MFAVTRIKGDNREILGRYKDLPTARFEAKRIYNETQTRNTISVIEADFDDDDNIISGRYKLYDLFF